MKSNPAEKMSDHRTIGIRSAPASMPPSGYFPNAWWRVKKESGVTTSLHFFNRVRTGYDWNKYNRTHYDHDNPPPKTVQGYKFNIFYPDLIDRSEAPTFHVEAGPTTVCVRVWSGYFLFVGVLLLVRIMDSICGFHKSRVSA